MRSLAVFLALLMAAATFAVGDGLAKKRPKRRSRRWDLEYGKKKVEPVKPRRARPQKKEILPAWRLDRLAPGRWSGEAGDQLEGMLDKYGRGIEGYSEFEPPVAVLIWDDVSVYGHVGEALFYRLVTEAEFIFNEEFWALVPLQFGRIRIRGGYEGFKNEPRRVWDKNADYLMYRKAFFKSYQDYCREFGKTRCRRWLTQLLVGWEERDLLRVSRQVIAAELRRPVAVEKVEEFTADPRPVMWPVGLRKVPEMEDLYANLRKKGFDIWILSSSNNWSVQEFAREYNVHRTRVLAVRVKVTDEKLSAQALIPVPEGAGETVAVATFIGRSPVLIIAGEGDDQLLGFGRGVRIQLVDADSLRTGLPRKRWTLQPRLSPVREPQERAAAF